MKNLIYDLITSIVLVTLMEVSILFHYYNLIPFNITQILITVMLTILAGYYTNRFMVSIARSQL
jgi:hypothetical protein